MASDNLKKPEILKAIQTRRDELAAAAGITPEAVLREWWTIATADPTELVTVVNKRCAFCWPLNDQELPPNPKCPQCDGEGVTLARLADLSKVSPAARRLFASAEQGKEGVKIKTRDQDAAWRNIADYLGMQNKSKAEVDARVSGGLLHATPADLTDEQAWAFLLANASPDALEAVRTANLGVSAGVSNTATPLTLEASVG